jgi:hypothetical protein
MEPRTRALLSGAPVGARALLRGAIVALVGIGITLVSAAIGGVGVIATDHGWLGCHK